MAPLPLTSTAATRPRAHKISARARTRTRIVARFRAPTHARTGAREHRHPPADGPAVGPRPRAQAGARLGCDSDPTRTRPLTAHGRHGTRTIQTDKEDGQTQADRLGQPETD